MQRKQGFTLVSVSVSIGATVLPLAEPEEEDSDAEDDEGVARDGAPAAEDAEVTGTEAGENEAGVGGWSRPSVLSTLR